VGDNDTQASGASRRENADVYLLFDIRIETLAPSLRGALLSAEARLWAKADATKQSMAARKAGLLRRFAPRNDNG
jgi:hypothetical protein